MAAGGDISRANGKKGGRPKGSGAKPHISEYWDKKQVEEFFQGMYERQKNDARLAVWCGDQLSGKAPQALTGPNGEPLVIQFANVFNQKGNAE